MPAYNSKCVVCHHQCEHVYLLCRACLYASDLDYKKYTSFIDVYNYYRNGKTHNEMEMM